MRGYHHCMLIVEYKGKMHELEITSIGRILGAYFYYLKDMEVNKKYDPV